MSEKDQRPVVESTSSRVDRPSMSSPERGKWSPEQRKVLSRIGEMREEVYERLLSLERMQTMNQRMRPDDWNLLHTLVYVHPEQLSGDALGDVRQVLDGDERSRTLAFESITELKDLIALESNIYEDAGREKSERETIVGARTQHLKVIMQEWEVN